MTGDFSRPPRSRLERVGPLIFPILLVTAVITTGVMGAFLPPDVPTLTVTPTRVASIRPPALPPLVPPSPAPPATVPPPPELPTPSATEPPAATVPPPSPPVTEQQDIGPAGPGTADPRALTFPLRGDCLLTASFGDPRPGGRRHEGEDVMAPKMTPVIAIADGTVAWLRSEIGSTCCAVTVRHDDGWSSRYLHLNNDSPGTDDNQGYGLAPGLAVGTRVSAGSVIGWVGDSGNAEQKAPHLHFELRDPTGRPVDPYPVLQATAAQAEAQGYLVRSLRPAESD